MSTYILLKDWWSPQCKVSKGETFSKTRDTDTAAYINEKGTTGLHPIYVENNPEWFAKKEEPIGLDLQNAIYTALSNGWQVLSPQTQIYFEHDLRKAFEESRKKHPLVGFKFDTFEDYLKSIKP